MHCTDNQADTLVIITHRHQLDESYQKPNRLKFKHCKIRQINSFIVSNSLQISHFEHWKEKWWQMDGTSNQSN